MSWRTVVVSSSAKLDYQMGYLVVRKDTTTKIHSFCQMMGTVQQIEDELMNYMED